MAGACRPLLARIADGTLTAYCAALQSGLAIHVARDLGGPLSLIVGPSVSILHSIPPAYAEAVVCAATLAVVCDATLRRCDWRARLAMATDTIACRNLRLRFLLTPPVTGRYCPVIRGWSASPPDPRFLGCTGVGQSTPEGASMLTQSQRKDYAQALRELATLCHSTAHLAVEQMSAREMVAMAGEIANIAEELRTASHELLVEAVAS